MRGRWCGSEPQRYSEIAKTLTHVLNLTHYKELSYFLGAFSHVADMYYTGWQHRQTQCSWHRTFWQNRELNQVPPRTESLLPPHTHASFQKRFLSLNKNRKIFSYPLAYNNDFKQFLLFSSISHELLIWVAFSFSSFLHPHFNKTWLTCLRDEREQKSPLPSKVWHSWRYHE